MTVLRIVTNIPSDQIQDVQKFYSDLFDLSVVMDHGWIVTLSSGEKALCQISFATEGGSGTKVPDLSIEVDDVDAVHKRAKNLGYDIEYELTNEPWGVRRFYLFDPTGKLLNILSHSS